MLKNRSKLFDKNYLLVKKKKSSSPNYKNKNDENYDACLHLWLKLSINRRISFPRSRHLVFATFARHSRDSSKLKRRAGDRGSFPVNGTYPRSAKSSRETARFRNGTFEDRRNRSPEIGHRSPSCPIRSNTPPNYPPLSSVQVCTLLIGPRSSSVSRSKAVSIAVSTTSLSPLPLLLSCL